MFISGHVIGPDDLVKDYRGMSHVKVVGVENVVSAVNTVKQDANDDRFVCLFLSDTSSDKSSAVKVDEDVHKKKACSVLFVITVCLWLLYIVVLLQSTLTCVTYIWF